MGIMLGRAVVELLVMVAVAVSAGKSAVPNGVQFLVSTSVLLQRVWLDGAVNPKRKEK